MFENKVYVKATNPSEENFLKRMGIEYKRLDDISDITRNHARNMALLASDSSDFICFMIAAERKREKRLRYKIHAQYTSDDDKVSMLGQLLAECGVIKDIFYSTVSRSFLIEMPESSRYTFSEYLLIGIAEKIKFNKNASVFYNDNNEIFYWDNQKGLLRLKLKVNRTFAYDIPGHGHALAELFNTTSNNKERNSP